MAADSHVREAIRHGQVIRNETTELISEVRQAASEINDWLDIPGRMERAPYQTMAIAAGVGYVLGGGLFSSLTGKALRIGFKVMLVPMINAKLMELAEAAAQGAQSVGGQSGVQQGYAGPDSGPGRM
ncbi:MAG: hypothetical protein ACK4N5_21375 [Myxococcales bacterium]